MIKDATTSDTLLCTRPTLCALYQLETFLLTTLLAHIAR